MNKVFAAILGASLVAMHADSIEIIGTRFIATVATQAMTQANDASGVSTT
ncbi:MAG: hypothetical protein ABL878_19300 [Burkholderiales bacterium]